MTMYRYNINDGQTINLIDSRIVGIFGNDVRLCLAHIAYSLNQLGQWSSEVYASIDFEMKDNRIIIHDITRTIY